ncbi:hypothetical protein ACFXHA_26230 [Nocardia sp. NPDC059240]|uniref:hypothetical protein n=1 Tax=Nocardia sp. NPDC059240 TaxID=3346786 RepID=UPI0036CF07E8
MTDIAPARYDRKALMHAYLDAVQELSRLNWATGDEAEAAYARWSQDAAIRSKTRLAYLVELEALFQVNLMLEDPFPDAPLLMLLRSTARSYHAIQTPFSNYLAAGLIVEALEEAGIEESVSECHDRMLRATDALHKQHLEMLDTLLRTVLGDQADAVYELDDPAAAAIVLPEYGNPWDDW